MADVSRVQVTNSFTQLPGISFETELFVQRTVGEESDHLAESVREVVHDQIDESTISTYFLEVVQHSNAVGVIE